MGGILLDTNVLSELTRAKPAAAVLNWFGRQQNGAYFVSVITRAEILLGIALLPAGKRRDGLAPAAEQMLKEDFAGRTLPFDDSCAAEYSLTRRRANPARAFDFDRRWSDRRYRIEPRPVAGHAQRQGLQGH